MEHTQLASYFSISLFFLITILLSVILILVPTLLSRKQITKEKLSPYECGFNPLGSSSKNININFYLVSILFIIFDLEIAFLLPWALEFKNLGIKAMFTMSMFLFILIVGLLYELKEGALEWK